MHSSINTTIHLSNQLSINQVNTTSIKILKTQCTFHSLLHFSISFFSLNFFFIPALSIHHSSFPLHLTILPNIITSTLIHKYCSLAGFYHFFSLSSLPHFITIVTAFITSVPFILLCKPPHTLFEFDFFYCKQ